MASPTVKFVLDFLENSSVTETAKFLISHENCLNPNEMSIQSAVGRVREKHSLLKKSSGSTKGKIDIDAFLASQFPFPKLAKAKIETGR